MPITERPARATSDASVRSGRIGDIMSNTTNTNDASIIIDRVHTPAEWLAADRRTRNAMHRYATDAFRTAMDAGDASTAMSIMTTLAAYVAVPATRTPVVIDWDTIVADRIATLDASIAALRRGEFDGAPDGYELISLLEPLAALIDAAQG